MQNAPSSARRGWGVGFHTPGGRRLSTSSDVLPAHLPPSANTAAGLEDPRRLARRVGCRWGGRSLDSVDRASSLPKVIGDCQSAAGSRTRQQKNLTRMNDDKNDDADLSRRHQLSRRQRPFCCQRHTRANAERKGVSVPAEPIRVIVMIVVHPREVFDVLLETRPVPPLRGSALRRSGFSNDSDPVDPLVRSRAPSRER